MERLIEAIAKARAERHGEIGQMPDQEEIVSTAEIDSQAEDQLGTQGAKEDEQSEKPLEFAYSQTRKVDINDKELKENRVIAGFRHDIRVEIYRQLRSLVLNMMRKNKWRTLAITSPGENAGKTLTAANLAISLSQDVNQTVMLVDLDLRKPSVHKTFNVNCDKGLIDCMRGNEPLEEVLVNPGYPRLVILPGNELGVHSSELLTSPEMRRLLDEIISRYDSRLIIFDLPPLLRNDDALVFAPLVEATLLVVEEGVSTPDDIQHSLRLLKGSNLIGTILNKAR